MGSGSFEAKQQDVEQNPAIHSAKSENNTLNLPLGRYAFTFRCEEALKFPSFPGSAWRGAFGHALKRTVCVVRHQQCESCSLRTSCTFPYFFDTPPPPDATRMRRYRTAPHPFVFSVVSDGSARLGERLEPEVVPAGGRLGVVLTLIGHANRALAYVVHALGMLGERGLGPARVRLHLESVAHLPPGNDAERETIFRQGTLMRVPARTPPFTPAPPAHAHVRLLTPLRLKRDNRLVTPRTFRPADLLGHLVRRISMLTYFHTDSPLEMDFRRLRDLAATVEVEDADLRWFDWTRRSGRQGTLMQMGGLLGEFALDFRDAEELWPFLWLGQWVHAGKGATMSLGAYRLTPGPQACDTPPADGTRK